MVTTTTTAPPYAMFDVRVARTTRVTPHMVRITFTGEDLAHFADNGYDQRIKLILPPQIGTLDDVPRGDDWFSRWREMPEDRRAPIRTYTVRAARAPEQELDVDLVDHGDLGPASAFARRAQPGDRTLVMGPNARHPGPHGGLEFAADLAGRTDLLIAGDDTAVPAVCAIVERLPEQARGLIVLEVEDVGEFQQLTAPPGVRIEWVVRQGDRGVAQAEVVRRWLEQHPVVGEVRGADSTVYFDGEEDNYWETSTDRGTDVPPLVAWIAGESSVVRALRRVVVKEYEVPRAAVAFMGYWREGHREV